MRNMKSRNALWLAQINDYPADMRKLKPDHVMRTVGPIAGWGLCVRASR
jgi:hypothetical protein